MNQADFSYLHPGFVPDEQYIAQWSYTPENSKFTFSYSEVRDGIERLLGSRDKGEYKKWVNRVFMPAHPEFDLNSHDDREDLIHAVTQIALMAAAAMMLSLEEQDPNATYMGLHYADFQTLSKADQKSRLNIEIWEQIVFEMFIMQKLPFPEQYGVYLKSCQRVAPYTDFGNGIKGCVLMLSWNSSEPQLYLIDNDDRQPGTAYETYTSFLPYEVRLHYNYVEDCKNLNDGIALTSIEDYHKYHIVMLCGARQSELIDDMLCTLINKSQNNRHLYDDNRFLLHFQDNLLKGHAAQDMLELAFILDNKDEWRQQIISKVLDAFKATQIQYNTFQRELDKALTHYANILKNKGYSGQILIGERMLKEIQSNPGDFLWWEWLENYENDHESIKLVDYTPYSIKDVIAFIAYTKHLYMHPTVTGDLQFEQVTVDERVSAFELYLKGMEAAALKHLQQQDDPLRSHRPTQSEAHNLAISWIEKSFNTFPSYLPDDLKDTYLQYEEAFKSNIGYKRHDPLDDLMEFLENRPKTPVAVPYDMVKAMAFADEKYQHYVNEVEPLVKKSLDRWWSKIPTHLHETALEKKTEELSNTLMRSGFFNHYDVEITQGFIEEMIPLADSQNEANQMMMQELFGCAMEDLFDGIDILNEQKLERHLYTNQNRLTDDQIMAFYIYQTSTLFLTSIKEETNETVACPWFTPNATSKDKQEFDKQLKELCASNKKTQASDIKKFLKSQEDCGIICLPKYGRKTNNSSVHSVLSELYGYSKCQANFSAANGF